VLSFVDRDMTDIVFSVQGLRRLIDWLVGGIPFFKSFGKRPIQGLIYRWDKVLAMWAPCATLEAELGTWTTVHDVKSILNNLILSQSAQLPTASRHGFLSGCATRGPRGLRGVRRAALY